ncbi:MAG TPA: hypothetical protein VMW38_23925 [Terriglobia bacterium]|nr:hypothetical protein [Terriglobia bacterium]
MVQIDIPIAFGIGTLFADAANKQLQKGRPEYYYRTFNKNLVYQAFFFSWIPIYFLLNYFGWETTHMWWHEDSVSAYPYLVVIVIALFFMAAVGGFLLGYRLVRMGRIWPNRIIYLAILVYSGIWIFGQVNRSFRLGTYTDWVDGRAPWFYEDPTFLFMLILTLVVWAVPLAVLFVRLRREGMHLDPVFPSQS